MKRNRTDARRAKGFTLVELIVVIAILGILAGGGAVAYSGYVIRSQDANDNLLLGSLNKAFATACMENGKNPQEVVDAYGFICAKDDAETGLKKGAVLIVASAIDPSGETFKYYFQDDKEDINSPGVFQRHFSLDYVNGEGRFELGLTKRAFAADLGILIDEAINNQFKNSVFFNENDPESVKKLMAATDAISLTLSGGQPGEAVKDVAGDPEFEAYLRNVCHYSDEDVSKVIVSENKTDCNGKPTKDYSKSDPKQITAATILYTADQMANMTAHDVAQKIRTNSFTVYPDTLNEISSASTTYAGIVGFANSPYSEGFSANLTYVIIDPTKANGTKSGSKTCYTTLKDYLSQGNQIGGNNLLGLYNALQKNQAYKNYLKNDDGLERDMEGYVAAMQILSESKYVLADENGKLDLTKLNTSNGNHSTGFGRYTGTINTVVSYFDD